MLALLGFLLFASTAQSTTTQVDHSAVIVIYSGDAAVAQLAIPSAATVKCSATRIEAIGKSEMRLTGSVQLTVEKDGARLFTLTGEKIVVKPNAVP